MFIPWRIGSFPELEHLSESDRNRLLQRVLGKGWIAYTITRASTVGIVAGLPMVVLIGGGRRVDAIALATAIACAACVAAIYYWCWVVRTRGQLRIYFERVARTESLPMCLNCGYNLAGIQGQVCPECGRQIPRPDVEQNTPA
jgi:hypothetical protein